MSKPPNTKWDSNIIFLDNPSKDIFQEKKQVLDKSNATFVKQVTDIVKKLTGLRKIKKQFSSELLFWVRKNQ